MGNSHPKILTFNAKFSVMGEGFTVNQDILMKKIVDGGYDIAAIQECTQSFRDKVRKREEYNTCYYHGNLIMCKWDLKEVARHKNYIICETECNGVDINVCSVHLPSARKNSDKRTGVFDSLMDNINRENVIVMGDFNMSADEYGPLCIKYPELLVSRELNTYGNQFPYDRIILIGGSIRFVNSAVASDVGTRSDHLALSSSILVHDNAERFM